jgi:hypothetical protein
MAFCAYPCADIGLFAEPLSTQHMSSGANTYTFYTLGPDLEHGVGLYLLKDVKTTPRDLGQGLGNPEMVSKWASEGFIHRFSSEDGTCVSLSAGGVFVGILVGPE